jgi:PKHD-type hydroxylase
VQTWWLFNIKVNIMKGEWCYFKQKFTPEQCKLIIDLASNLPVQDATLGVEGKNLDTSFRKSKVKFIMKDDPNFTWLYDEMWKMAIQANDDFFGLHISRIDYMQLAEYDASYRGEYKEHHDVFWVNNDPVYHRKLTSVTQLTPPNEYRGGNLEFVDLQQYPNADELRTQGTSIFFPSLFRHRATPVTEGTRYSLACWFDGPKWR